MYRKRSYVIHLSANVDDARFLLM